MMMVVKSRLPFRLETSVLFPSSGAVANSCEITPT